MFIGTSYGNIPAEEQQGFIVYLEKKVKALKTELAQVPQHSTKRNSSRKTVRGNGASKRKVSKISK